MSKIAILLDSGCNIKEDIDNGIFVVPIYVNFNDISKRDLVDIDPKELYERIDEDVQTAAPGINDFMSKIEIIKEMGYEKILGIAISLALSATFNSMKLALESSDMEYKILDSKGVSISSSVIALYGSELISRGLELDEVYNKLEEKIKDVKFYAVIQDLKYLIRGGRISHVKGVIGSMLKVNPILSINEDGKIYNYKSTRGRANALKYVKDLVKNDLKDKKNYYFSLAYAKDKSDIDEMRENFSEEIKNAKVYIEEPITAALGVHAGPTVYGVCYMEVD